jgi:hypothetical protein
VSSASAMCHLVAGRVPGDLEPGAELESNVDHGAESKR